jgi:heme oxygenase
MHTAVALGLRNGEPANTVAQACANLSVKGEVALRVADGLIAHTGRKALLLLSGNQVIRELTKKLEKMNEQRFAASVLMSILQFDAALG